MSDVAPYTPGAVDAFRPEQTGTKLAQLEADIVLWRKLKDWPKLEEAISAKIEEQAEFVAWWDAGPGQRESLGSNQHRSVAVAGPTTEDAEAQTGISKQTVSRWRTWLKDRDTYRERIARGSFRAAGLIESTAAEYHAPIVPDGKFATIVVDPPWPMSKIEREVRPNQAGFDYPTMSASELAAWPVIRDTAADDCHLFCWTTQKWLPAALLLMAAWDFRYCLTMVWHKPGGFQPIGLPQYNCEFVIYARRGAPEFADTTAFPCCFAAPRREHSRKPDEFYDLIRRVAPEPRIDIFSREWREGFAQFGNETGRFAA